MSDYHLKTVPTLWNVGQIFVPISQTNIGVNEAIDLGVVTCDALWLYTQRQLIASVVTSSAWVGVFLKLNTVA